MKQLKFKELTAEEMLQARPRVLELYDHYDIFKNDFIFMLIAIYLAGKWDASGGKENEK